jgi:hypothetical protein
MSILQNAIDSIQIGVEDFQSTDDRRSASAVRNIAAGMLLLFKEKLCELSPAYDKELLIKRDLEPESDAVGNIVFRGKGKKTVDVFQIKERLTSLKVNVDWKRLEEITSLRNDLEHYFAKKSPDAVREVVAKSFLIIRDFTVDALGKDPQELLGEECWSVFLSTSEVYLAEERACSASIGSIDWKYKSVDDALSFLRCPACNSALVEAPSSTDVYPDIHLRCKSCAHEFGFSDVLEECIDELLSGEAHRSIKDGGDSPYGTCPSCGQDTYIYEEKCCVACGSGLGYSNCSACEVTLTLEDQDNDGMCSYCNYKFQKLMRE